MLISLKQIHKIYGKPPNAFEALKGIDLDVTQGEFIALMGPSGSGKSTLANILGCLDNATSGVYDFLGVDVTHLNLKQKALLRRNYIGFIFQGFNLLPRTTALENVELPLLYRQVPKKERMRLSMQALEMVGLDKWSSHQSNELSGGQQQRVAIARAIAQKPLFLLADEPTGNLDTKRSVEIMDILKDLNLNSKITILMVTHEPEMAQYASRKIEFLDGLIKKDSALKEIK
ncbi:MAG: ABC transporter ATP-binding protein [Helicobacter sp.]|nr:ABC transporter ATP-binding protein [Helicobacteraceae bacterium]MDY3113672.1 ABC transporter ATP-binding protein [Helicobacter sp.]